MTVQNWQPLPKVAQELGLPDSWLYDLVRRTPEATRQLKLGDLRVTYVDVDRMCLNKARIRQVKSPWSMAPQWSWRVPLPDGETVSGITSSHARAVNHVDILIKAWWHR
jgi:hypothetical protein